MEDALRRIGRRRRIGGGHGRPHGRRRSHRAISGPVLALDGFERDAWLLGLLLLSSRRSFRGASSRAPRDGESTLLRDRVAAETGGGPAGVPPSPLSDQTACKPGSVGRGLASPRDGHSSATPVARRLQQPTRTARSGHRSRPARSRGQVAPSLFGLAPGGVCPAADVAAGAVRSYRTISPLPADAVATTGGLFSVALSLGLMPAGRYPAPHVHGARTFLPVRLSALARAAVQPTDNTRDGQRRRERQEAQVANSESANSE
jgi:hypothetical protein